MRRATVRVHGTLAGSLPAGRRDAAFEVAFGLPVGLRDPVQSTGIPHVEVGRAVVDGREAEWSLLVDEALSGMRPRVLAGIPSPPPGAPRRGDLPRTGAVRITRTAPAGFAYAWMT